VRAFYQEQYETRAPNTYFEFPIRTPSGGRVWIGQNVQTLQSGTIAPTLGLEVPDPELDLDYVPHTARPLAAPSGRPAAALSNSFAFGGHNVALVFKGAAAE